MNGQYTDFRNSKAVVGLAVANIVLGTLIYELEGAASGGCSVLANTAWVALELLRSVILLAHGAAASTYLCEGPRLFENLLEIGASVVPLVCAIAR